MATSSAGKIFTVHLPKIFVDLNRSMCSSLFVDCLVSLDEMFEIVFVFGETKNFFCDIQLCDGIDIQNQSSNESIELIVVEDLLGSNECNRRSDVLIFSQLLDEDRREIVDQRRKRTSTTEGKTFSRSLGRIENQTKKRVGGELFQFNEGEHLRRRTVEKNFEMKKSIQRRRSFRRRITQIDSREQITRRFQGENAFFVPTNDFLFFFPIDLRVDGEKIFVFIQRNLQGKFAENVEHFSTTDRRRRVGNDSSQTLKIAVLEPTNDPLKRREKRNRLEHIVVRSVETSIDEVCRRRSIDIRGNVHRVE